jgi:enolase
MMLAHYLWDRTPGGGSADEGAWVSALDQAAADTAPLMRAIWKALTANERRVARALAVVRTPLYSAETATAVGIKRSSIRKALESLVANADVIHEHGRPRLTDPMLELWLQSRGLTPAAGEDEDSLPS